MIVRGEGPYIFDSSGKRYLDGLSGLFVVQAGHGRQELADAAAKQASELAYIPLWFYAHPKAVELADRLADLAPGDLNRIFFGYFDRVREICDAYDVLLVSDEVISAFGRSTSGPSGTATSPTSSPVPRA